MHCTFQSFIYKWIKKKLMIFSEGNDDSILKTRWKSIKGEDLSKCIGKGLGGK